MVTLGYVHCQQVPWIAEAMKTHCPERYEFEHGQVQQFAKGAFVGEDGVRSNSQ